MKYINKLILLSLSIVNFINVNTLFLIKKKSINSKITNEKVIISLTSFPARIKFVHQTIKSILIRNENKCYIFIYLSTDEFPDLEKNIPTNLLALKKYGLRIIFVDGNVRSYKKLIYAMSTFPDKSIITIDDDIYYPKKWLDNLINLHNDNPHDILFFRGHRMYDSHHKILPYKKMISAESTYGIDNYNFYIPTGIGGILYPANSLYKDFNNIILINKLAPYADDLWFKKMGELNNTNYRRVLNRNITFPPILGTQKISLYKKNVINKTQELIDNDSQLKKILEHYN